MSLTYKKALRLFSKNKANKLLSQSEHALERECLRVDKNGEISAKPHPKKLGEALTNPYITTDFAQAQLELVTPRFKSEKAAIDFLTDIHNFVYKGLDKDELLWPTSMPCRLPKKERDIMLAQYGVSNEARRRTLYRHGLGLRYGRKMQTVSGVHYNFSFSQSFWKFLHQKQKSKLSLQDFISEKYFHMMRNFLRYGWINSYLFGASPAIDKSYIKKRPKALNRCGRKTCYANNATSLRISDFGYNSKIQKQLIISFNNLEQYIQDIDYAVTTPNETYAAMGVYKKGQQIQMNDHWLQIENEYYSPVRPKQPHSAKETVRQALKERGVKYLEIRSVDIDFKSPAGISEDQLIFLHSLLLFCLFKQSPSFNKDQKKQALQNWNKVGFYGRNTDIALSIDRSEKTLLEWSDKIFHELKDITALLDKAHKNKKYSRNLQFQKEKLYDPDLTPSKQMIDEIVEKKNCFISLGLKFAELHKKAISSHKSFREDLFKKSVADSIYMREGKEIYDEFVYEPYADMELSTQMIIRQAEKMKINVEILDRKDNFLLLSKGRKKHYVKQATFSSHDSVISYFQMDNKKVMKHLLKSHGITVPLGNDYSNIDLAISDYEKYRSKKIVIKPQNTNYGIGINFVKKNDPKGYQKSLQNAFHFDDSVIVEEFIQGKEFRFLVIDDRVISVIERLPANVVGDGEKTIKHLVDEKNHNPRNYKIEKYFIKLGEIERAHLSSQRMKLSSVPAKGKRIWLRSNSNISTGGDQLDVTDLIPDTYKKIARKAAAAASAKFCGVDIIIKNINQAPNSDNHSIIEINYNPMLYMHEFTINGPRRNIAKPVLKAIGF